VKAFKKSDNSPKVICLTPVRNESWIIKPFLAASKMWADHVIVAEGCSDGTLELLQSTRDVETIINAAKTYDERPQRLLVDKAREIPGKRILIVLDADEILS
jgi:Glycosyl transferase family 2